jgi:hypothetical protein
MDFSDLEQKYGGFRRFDPKKPKVTGRGNQYGSALISEAAGTGGALGGAAVGAGIGSFAGPVGTIIGGGIGGLIGGFGGGFGGRAVENKVRDDQFNLDTALQEGAISGAFGALGGGARALKGVRAGAKALSGVDDVARTASKVGTEATKDLSRVSKFGLRQESAAKGLSPGVKVGGRTLSLSQADDLGKFTQQNFRAGTPIQILEQVEPAIKAQSDELARILSTSTGKISSAQSKQLQKQMLDQVRKDVPTLFSASGKPNAKLTSLTSRFSGAKTASELDEARKVADTFINFGRASAKEPEFEQAARVIRDLADKQITSLVPDAKTAKTFISKALDAQDAIIKAAKPPVSGFGGGGGLFNRIAESAPAEGARSYAGRAASSIGSIGSTGVGGNIGTAIGATRALPPGMLGRGLVGREQQQAPLSLDDALMQQGQQGFGEQGFDQSGFGQQDFGGSQEQQPVSQNPYPRENLLYDVQRDPTNAEEYIKQYQLYQEVFAAPEGNGLELNNTAIQSISDTQAGLDQLGKLQSTFETSSANNPVIGRLRGYNPFDTEAQSFDSQLRLTRQIIGKALEGGVLRKEDEAKYSAILPNAGDTDATAVQKLQTIQQDIQSKLDGYIRNQSVYGGGGSLEDTLIQQGIYN